jgi:hypothetical protein
MKQHSGDEAELRRYLLGELTQEKRVAVEARLFLDDDYLSQLKAVEDELVDEDAYDELSAGEREKFASHFLTRPEHRLDLGIARALKRFISSEAQAPDHLYSSSTTVSVAGIDASRPHVEGRFARLASLFRRRPVMGFSLAAAALVVLSFIAWFVIESWRVQNTNRQMQAQEPKPQLTEPAERQQHDPANKPPVNSGSRSGGEEIAERQRDDRGNAERIGRQGEERGGRQTGRPRGSPPPARQMPTQVATFLILPGGGARGEGRTRSVLLSTDVRTVILKLPLADGDQYHSYRATLRTGARPYIRANLKPEVDAEFGRVVSVKVPANLFHQQSYRMELSSVTDTGQIRKLRSYTFQVERK